MCCYPGVAYKELLRDWHVLCAFLGCLLPHLQHGLPHCGKGFGDPASLASAAPVHTCSRSESIDSKSVSASYVKVICNLQGCSASLSTFTVATDSFLWKHRDELVCIRLQLGLSCFGIAVQLATQVALMHQWVHRCGQWGKPRGADSARGSHRPACHGGSHICQSPALCQHQVRYTMTLQLMSG